MMRQFLLLTLLPVLGFAQSTSPATDLTDRVARMARIGSATAPSFSPDGRWLSVIANVSGLPQVYVIPVEGGWPRMITDGTDRSRAPSGLPPPAATRSPSRSPLAVD